MQEIALGDTILVEGHEYVIMTIQFTHDKKGRSINIYAQDPFIAQSVLDGYRTEDKQRQNITQVSELIPLLKKQMDDSSS